MRDTSSIGNKTEAIVLAALVHAGYLTLLPFGGGHPYDIALDVGDKLLRVQCKTGRLMKEGVVFFPTASWCRSLRYRSYRGDVDLFGVYCPGTQQVYLVPIEDVPERLRRFEWCPLRTARQEAFGGRRTTSSARRRRTEQRRRQVMARPARKTEALPRMGGGRCTACRSRSPFLKSGYVNRRSDCRGGLQA